MQFVPLIDEAQYSELRRIRAELLAQLGSRIAQVFVPVGASHTNESAPRILFVGQATADYSEEALGTFENSVKTNIDLLQNHADSVFIDFMWHIAEESLKRANLPHDQAAIAGCMGWSNLAKIGCIAGNPSGNHLRMQAALCSALLKSEVATWKPKAVVFATSEYATGEILLPAFGGRDTWAVHPNTEHVWFKEDQETGCHLIWTLYPGRKGNALWNQVQPATVELIGEAIRHAS